MKKLEDIVLNKGDIVEFDDGDVWAIDGLCYQKASFFIQEVKSIKRPTQYETIYEKPDEILDKEEKEWLENVVRPFKDKVKYINKFQYLAEWIVIKLHKGSIEFPRFKKNTMYKGMEVGKNYTLEELGLFK